MGPREGVVENIEWSVLDIFRLHNLNGEDVCREVTLFDGVEQILDMVVGLFSSESFGDIRGQCFDSAFWLVVPFDVDVASVLDHA